MGTKISFFLNVMSTLVTYLEVIFNWDNITVINSVDDRSRNLHLARCCYFSVWFNGVPNTFEQSFGFGFGGFFDTVLYFQLQSGFGSHWFGRGVADFGKSRQSVTWKKKKKEISLHWLLCLLKLKITFKKAMCWVCIFYVIFLVFELK